MTKFEAVKTLRDNYRLEQSMYDYTIDLLAESGLNDFKELLQIMANSKKFDYMAKLHDSIETLEKVRLQLNYKELTQIENYGNQLFSKLTDICEFIRRDTIPSVEYIKNIDFNNIKKFDKTMYFELYEARVNSLIGDSLEIYRLATQYKPLLQEKIKEIMIDLTKKKKSKTMAITYENNPVDKLMKLN